jgi:transcriptional regulator of acetoin/glycerol metabolism
MAHESGEVQVTDPVRQARQELIRAGLLTGTTTAGVVPDLIVRSWRRSISNKVNGERPSSRFTEVDADSILRRAADPVLDRWQGQLADTGTTLFLSDRAGNIVARRTSDSSIRRRLDSVNAAEGFDYSEDSIGTNGLGTSMVEGRAVLITGSQHYNDALAALACAAAPVYTPTGSVIGSISLGGPIEAANPLMLSLTREIGQQIEERLRGAARPQDLALAMSFMRFTNSARPTVVMDSESLLANTPGVPYVDVTSHVMLWELLNSHDWASSPTLLLQLDEAAVEVSARRVLDGPRAHYVLHFADLTRTIGRAEPAVRQALPTVAKQRAAGGVIWIDGPPGSGRATLARDLAGPSIEEIVVTAGTPTPWDRIGELLHAGTTVLLCRVEHLADEDADRLGALIDEIPSAARLFITASRDQSGDAVGAVLNRIGVPRRTAALASTPERIPGLVKLILDRVDPKHRHTVSPAALQAFVQWNWPGNITELAETLTDLVAQVPTSVIERRHLPQQLQHAPPRRQLTLMESAERDAIIKALAAAGGNKSEAAELLGVGRTTLYRRLRQLGLDRGEDAL